MKTIDRKFRKKSNKIPRSKNNDFKRDLKESCRKIKFKQIKTSTDKITLHVHGDGVSPAITTVYTESRGIVVDSQPTL